MEIAKKIGGRKYDESPNLTYVEKQCGQIITLNVYYFTNRTVCMPLKCVYNKRGKSPSKTSLCQFYHKVQ